MILFGDPEFRQNKLDVLNIQFAHHFLLNERHKTTIITKLLRYVLQDRWGTERKVAGSIPRWDDSDFSKTQSVRPHYSLELDLVSNRNECQGYLMRDKGGQCRLSRNSGNLNLLDRNLPVQTCKAVALPWCSSRQDGYITGCDTCVKFIILTSVKETLTGPKQLSVTLFYKAVHTIIDPSVMSLFPLHNALHVHHPNDDGNRIL